MSSDDIVLSVKNVSKRFEMYDKPRHRLQQMLLGPFGKKYYREFWALRDINFEVHRGECVGVIGRNGAGKSTLLQIITGTLQPTSGEVAVHGRIAALLELGSGFNPEFTGRENVYMNAAILGLTKKETDDKFQEIVDFADIGEFIDQPVKTYSSGMMVRLAFAVQIAVDPEILIVDEALAVGDIAFQQKCYERIKRLREHNVTILLVSHDLSSILNLCSRTVLLYEHKLILDGSPNDVVEAYKKKLTTSSESIYNQNVEPDPAPQKTLFYSQAYATFANKKEYGSKKVEIIDWGIFNSSNQLLYKIDAELETTLRIWLKANCQVEHVCASFFLKDIKGREIAGINTDQASHPIGPMSPNQTCSVTFRQKFPLPNGNYILSFGCSGTNPKEKVEAFHRIYDILLIEVVNHKTFIGEFDLQSIVETMKL